MNFSKKSDYRHRKCNLFIKKYDLFRRGVSLGTPCGSLVQRAREGLGPNISAPGPKAPRACQTRGGFVSSEVKFSLNLVFLQSAWAFFESQLGSGPPWPEFSFPLFSSPRVYGFVMIWGSFSAPFSMISYICCITFSSMNIALIVHRFGDGFW